MFAFVSFVSFVAKFSWPSWPGVGMSETRKTITVCGAALLVLIVAWATSESRDRSPGSGECLGNRRVAGGTPPSDQGHRLVLEGRTALALESSALQRDREVLPKPVLGEVLDGSV